MALFTDGSISTLEELRSYESAIYDLASTERIDLSQKLILARQEIGVDLTSWFFSDTPDQLEQVVVTPPLRLWHTFHALALTYRDAYNSHLNDRYRGKWQEYERLAKWASRSLCDIGVGMTSDPIPRPAPPSVSAASGTAGAAMYWIRVSWVSACGAEGSPSEPVVFAAAQGSVPMVQTSEAPAKASGWNVYAGLSNEDGRLQNESPIMVGATWSLPPLGLAMGRRAGDGQQPSSYLRIDRRLQRG